MNSKKRTTAAVATLTLVGGVAAVGVLISNKASVKSVSAQAAPDVIRLTGAIRDFPGTHPDFNTVPVGGFGHYAGNVKPILDGEGHPAFMGRGINAGGGQYEDIDLVAYWAFDDGTGNFATDALGLNHGFLMADADWVTGRYGGGIHFNGVNEYVEIPSSPEMQVTGDVTFAGWFKVDDTFTPSSPNTMVIMEKILDVDHDFHIGLAGIDYNRPEVPKGALVFKVENGPTSDYYRYTWTNQTTWTAGVWYHFAAVLDSSDTSKNALFINGVNDRSATDAGGIGFVDTDYDAPMRVGGKTIDYNGFATDIYFKGTVDEIMIFRRIVTEADFVAGTDGGFKVTNQWRDASNRPIAPHLYLAGSNMAPHPLAGFSGVGAQGTILVTNQGLVTGNPLVVSSNQTGSAGAITVDKAGSRIEGDVFVGPGGDPSTEILESSGGVITGTTGTLPATIPFPPMPVPDLGPSMGDLVATSSTVITSDLHVDTLTIQGVGSITVDGSVRIVCMKLSVENQGHLQLAPDSKLDLYVLGDIGLDSGQPNDVTIANDCSVNTALGDPAALNFFYLGDEGVILQNTSDVFWNLYAPNAALTIENGARMTGNFVGTSVLVRGARSDGTPSTLTVTGAFGRAGGPEFDVCGVLIDDTAGARGVADSGGITSSQTFAHWYRDILGVNLSAAHTITLANNGAGVYEFFDDAFHPIDDRLLGNDGASHNANFTYAIESSFTYEACAGQFLEFQGADDAWLFIDGKLAMDLGGVVPGTSQRVSMDRLGLTNGETYTFHFFYAQRHWASAMFRMRTNLPLDQGQKVMASGGFD